MRNLSGLANWLLLLDQDMGQVIDMDLSPQTRDGVERAYALVFQRELVASGFTPVTFIKAMEKATTPAWVRKSGLMGLMEMASPESCHSPLHDPKACKECQRESLCSYLSSEVRGARLRLDGAVRAVADAHERLDVAQRAWVAAREAGE